MRWYLAIPDNRWARARTTCFRRDAASAAAKAAGLDIGAIGLMSGAVKLAGLDYSLGSISTIGLVDVDELVEKLSVLARPGSADPLLDRERARQLWGCYVYVQVWKICLLVLIRQL